MKSILIYYSFSGNTRKVAVLLSENLTKKGEAVTMELRALDESRNFFKQCLRAFWHKHASIGNASFDFKTYDLICLGTPVWAFGPAPAINAVLEKCAGLENKQVLLFTTYGSGTGNERCLNYMQDRLSKKGATHFSRFSVQQFKVDQREVVQAKIQEALRLWPNG